MVFSLSQEKLHIGKTLEIKKNLSILIFSQPPALTP